MLIKLYNENPNEARLLKIVEELQRDGVIIFPTDSVYGLGCSINNHKAIERVAKLKGVKLEKSDFSFIFPDISSVSEFTKHIDNHVFKILKSNLPGPFTFILNANSQIPKIFRSKKKTIGIRIPDCPITVELVRLLGAPLLTTSIHDSDELLDYMTDPEEIYHNFKDKVDIVIDGGYGNINPSTVIDCTKDEFEIIRQGIGELQD